jgi:hypothetical protein
MGKGIIMKHVWIYISDSFPPPLYRPCWYRVLYKNGKEDRACWIGTSWYYSINDKDIVAWRGEDLIPDTDCGCNDSDDIDDYTLGSILDWSEVE